MQVFIYLFIYLFLVIHTCNAGYCQYKCFCAVMDPRAENKVFLTRTSEQIG